MTGDHGRMAKRATLLVTATDEIFGTNTTLQIAARQPEAGSGPAQPVRPRRYVLGRCPSVAEVRAVQRGQRWTRRRSSRSANQLCRSAGMGIGVEYVLDPVPTPPRHVWGGNV